MEIRHKRIVLRDETEADIADEIRWNTTETRWHDFDAPWEKEDDLQSFDAEDCRRKTLERIANRTPDGMRKSFEICLADGRHIGSTGSYYIDGECNFDNERRFSPPRHTIGIDICEPDCWGQGLGGEVYEALCRYYFSLGDGELYTQTWSGNERLLRMAARIGFEEFHRDVGMREVRGGVYDRVTLRLSRDKFPAKYGE